MHVTLDQPLAPSSWVNGKTMWAFPQHRIESSGLDNSDWFVSKAPDAIETDIMQMALPWALLTSIVIANEFPKIIIASASFPGWFV